MFKWMTVKMKKIATTFLLIILTFSLLLCLIPTPVKAARYDCESIIAVDYDAKAANDPFLPVDRIKEIPITLDYYVSGYFAEEVCKEYEGIDVFIYLNIDGKPDWCTASLSPNFLKMEATPSTLSENVTLIIKINKDAHAQLNGKIKLNATVGTVGPIKGGTFYSNISFIPGYYPLLDINTPDGIVKRIQPLDVTDFGIEIENLGNAKTIVTTSVLNIPDGWTVSIANETTLGTATIGDDPKKTILLTVRPSYEFGYHNERKVINVSLVPSLIDNPSVKGQEYFISFIVQNKGFSTPGFETVYLLAIIIGAGLIGKRHKVKTYNKHKKRGGG